MDESGDKVNLSPSSAGLKLWEAVGQDADREDTIYWRWAVDGEYTTKISVVGPPFPAICPHTPAGGEHGSSPLLASPRKNHGKEEKTHATSTAAASPTPSSPNSKKKKNTYSPVLLLWRSLARGAAGQASPWVAPSWDSDAWAAAASSRRVVSNSSIPACRLGLLHRGSRLAALGLGLASAGSEARRFLAGGLGVAGRGAQDWFHVGSHCAVSRNFAKLPVGVVCVADVQFKGRGFQAAQLGFVVVGKVVYFTSSNSVAGFQALEEQLL